MKCKTCGQDRPFKPIFIRNNIATFSQFLAERCKECGRLPANNPAISGKKLEAKP